MLQSLDAYKGKNVLLLQGPLGPFFANLARDLTVAGARVLKINFNGGDKLFSTGESVDFRGGVNDWAPFLETILSARKIDLIFLFGDCRPLHRIARGIAKRRHIEVGVFEEGYIRPDYLTLERFGANAHSKLPRIADFYKNVSDKASPPARPVGNVYWWAVLWAILYYLSSAAMYPWFRRYQHHRPLTLLEAIPWARSVWRKFYYKYAERRIGKRLVGDLSHRFFLVPLQVHTDAQIHTHSDFPSVAAFIEVTIASFSAHAPADTVLAIKHHPLDRAYNDYTRLIRTLAAKHQVIGRVFYIHDQHLPALLAHARGAVLVNSTVGLSAIQQGVPTKVCGRAMYDIPSLTYHGSLDDFWGTADSFAVDSTLCAKFITYLIQSTQINGNYYRKLDTPDLDMGVVWPLDEVFGPADEVQHPAFEVAARCQ